MAANERDFLWKLGNLEHLTQFLHGCVNTFSKPNTDYDNSISDTTWTEEDLNRARRKVQKIFRQSALDQNFSLSNDLPENFKNALANVYEIRQEDIMTFLIKENLVNSGHNLVENVDWKLKWILGSSQLATIREPVCQVELRCASAENDSRLFKRVVHFEATLGKVDELISLLNNAKIELDGI